MRRDGFWPGPGGPPLRSAGLGGGFFTVADGRVLPCGGVVSAGGGRVCAMTLRRLALRFWQRDLNAYPKGLQRYGLLTLVVASGICLTSLGLVMIGSISPFLIAQTGMSTSFYSYLLVVARLVPAPRQPTSAR